MDLIEQLGGYEATKEKYQALSDSDMITIGPVEFSARDYFEDELLEYRRQNNIFEVGDAVIRKWNGRLYYLIVDIDNDGQEFLIHHDKGVKFKDCRISDNICNFKHATGEEIKAGKRLGVS